MNVPLEIPAKINSDEALQIGRILSFGLPPMMLATTGPPPPLQPTSIHSDLHRVPTGPC